MIDSRANHPGCPSRLYNFSQRDEAIRVDRVRAQEELDRRADVRVDVALGERLRTTAQHARVQSGRSARGGARTKHPTTHSSEMRRFVSASVTTFQSTTVAGWCSQPASSLASRSHITRVCVCERSHAANNT